MGASAYPALGFDPCPGDPAGVAALAGSWRDAAFLLTEIALRLDGTEPAQARWHGRAASSFRARLGGSRTTLGTLRASYQHNADLLTGWAGRLTAFQTEAAALEARAAATGGVRPAGVPRAAAGTRCVPHPGRRRPGPGRGAARALPGRRPPAGPRTRRAARPPGRHHRLVRRGRRRR